VELRILKHGNLMGTPDAKEMLLRAGPGSDPAHQLWEEIAEIKTSFGYSGQCTSALIIDEERPEAFPALFDPSYLTVACDYMSTESIDRALEAISAAGFPPAEIKSVLVSHFHPDHFDPRLLDNLHNAVAYSHAEAYIPGCQPLDQKKFGDSIVALNTPGHGGPHTSYLLKLPKYDLAVCLAGDLVMSHAHYLAREHPLSFTDPKEGLASIATVWQELKQMKCKHALVFPGHGLPFFALEDL